MQHALEQRPLFWETLTWEEIGSLRRSGVDLCLLPVGATEQHGPTSASAWTPATPANFAKPFPSHRRTRAPALPYGCSLGHSRRWPGTLALQPQTLIDIVVEIFDWVHAAGFRRLLFVNGHVGNAAPLRCAVDIIAVAGTTPSSAFATSPK